MNTKHEVFKSGILLILIFVSHLVFASSQEIYFGFYEKVQLSANDFGLITFPKPADVVGSYSTGGKTKTFKFHVVSNDGTTLIVRWDQEIMLYDKNSLRNTLLSELVAEGINPSEDLRLDSLTVNSYVLSKSAYLVNPFILNLWQSEEDARSYTVTAKFLGNRQPKISMETVNNEKPRYKHCRITDFQLENDGTYSINFTSPNLKEGETSTGYFKVSNEVGFALNQKSMTDNELIQAFDDAVADAEVREYDEICNSLKALSPDNPDTDIVWDDKKEKVKVIVWTGNYWGSLKAGDIVNNLSPANDNELGYFMYVASYGEVVNFMKNNRFALNSELNNRLRLAQKLGLTIADGTTYQKTRFLVMWASPESLFRPAPDPEVNDQTTVMEVRYGQVEVANSWCTKHYEWKRNNSYNLDNYPYPFTGFGYTYDWGEPSTDIGVSEFTVLPLHPIEVIDNILTEDFFDSIPLK